MSEHRRAWRAGVKATAARLWVLGFLLSLGVSPALSQESAPATAEQTLRVSTEVVNVYAVVREKTNRLIPNLNREDFELSEDNVPQDIRYFSRETDTPLTLGIMIDTSPSQGRVLDVEQAEGKTFLRQVLRPKDLAFVLHFDSDVELLQDFTSNLNLLTRAIEETVVRGGSSGPLRSPLPSPLPAPLPPPDPMAGVGGTHLYDAIYLAARELMKNEVGRKVLILLSDGEDQGSKVKLDAALEAAHRSDVIVYSVAVIDRRFYWGHVMGFSGDSVLRKLSEQTGGRVIEVKRASDTGAAFQEIADELRTQYFLGYTPSHTRRGGSFRKIRLRVRDRDYKVQARRGYYAPSE
jgi:VWFA-related protein